MIRGQAPENLSANCCSGLQAAEALCAGLETRTTAALESGATRRMGSEDHSATNDEIICNVLVPSMGSGRSGALPSTGRWNPRSPSARDLGHPTDTLDPTDTLRATDTVRSVDTVQATDRFEAIAVWARAKTAVAGGSRGAGSRPGWLRRGPGATPAAAA